MTGRKPPNIIIEKINLERVRDCHEAVVESSQEWFTEGMIPKPDLSVDELENLIKDFIGFWENDNFYTFSILDATTNQVVGFAFLNHVNRQYQMSNLGYQVRTSRMGEGIATEAAKLVVRYGFKKLMFQRIEIVVRIDNVSSQKVAEKLGHHHAIILKADGYPVGLTSKNPIELKERLLDKTI